MRTTYHVDWPRRRSYITVFWTPGFGSFLLHEAPGHNGATLLCSESSCPAFPGPASVLFLCKRYLDR